MRLSRLITFRSIRARSARFILSAFGIVLGVAGLLSIRATNQTALNSIVELFESTSGRAKLTITSSSVGESGFSDQILSKVLKVPGVMVANPLVIAQTDLADSQPSGGIEMSFFAFTINREIPLTPGSTPFGPRNWMLNRFWLR